MAFPPQFSSTEKYANRLNLDRINVFVEGDSNNPMYFNITNLPEQLAYGKHFFNLSTLNSGTQDHELRPNSSILFEFKSINNIVLRSGVLDIHQQNGNTLCFVEVLRDPLRTFEQINDGQGILTIVGSLKNKSTTQNRIPQKFRKAINYRCTFPIDIKKNKIGSNSPFITNATHDRQTLNGQFCFTGAPISPPINDNNQGQVYSDDGTPAGGAPVRSSN